MRIKLHIAYKAFCTVLIIAMLIIVIIMKNRSHNLMVSLGDVYGWL